MKKIINIFTLALLLFYSLALLASPVSAKKRIGSGTNTSVVSSGPFAVYPRLTKDRKALLVTFSNLNAISSFSYELTYLGSGIDQGVFGQVTPKGENSTSRELLFGTCSHGVCRYHTGIKNMLFVVKATLKNGQTLTKKYRVKP